eukprot:3938509-Rhodomonas_salina.1
MRFQPFLTTRYCRAYLISRQTFPSAAGAYGVWKRVRGLLGWLKVVEGGGSAARGVEVVERLRREQTDQLRAAEE